MKTLLVALLLIPTIAIAPAEVNKAFELCQIKELNGNFSGKCISIPVKYWEKTIIALEKSCRYQTEYNKVLFICQGRI